MFQIRKMSNWYLKKCAFVKKSWNRAVGAVQWCMGLFIFPLFFWHQPTVENWKSECFAMKTSICIFPTLLAPRGNVKCLRTDNTKSSSFIFRAFSQPVTVVITLTQKPNSVTKWWLIGQYLRGKSRTPKQSPNYHIFNTWFRIINIFPQCVSLA